MMTTDATDGAALDLLVRGGVHTDVVEVTPAMATAWLELNNHNRPKSRRQVERLARIMTEGRWVVNGEAVKFDVNGRMLDGQHRCFACVMANTPFRTLVVTGLPSEVFPTLDRGKKRTGADVLAIDGEVNYNVLSAAVSALWRHQQGNGFWSRGPSSGPEPDEAREVLDSHPGLRISVARVGLRRRLLRPSHAAFLHYEFARRDRDLADWFMDRLTDGASLEADEPVYRLRERLLRNEMATAKLPDRDIIALTIKAWNKTVAGKRVKMLRWGGIGGEGFPAIEPAINGGGA